MKIAIMATGGVGGYFGARLAAAGEDVHFIARGQHLAALRANGLVLKSPNGDLHLQSVSATDDPASIGTVDIVIFAVKQYDTESAAKLIKPTIGADTAVITLQNGLDKDEWLRAVLGHGHVMDGAAYIADARVASPGVISHVGKVARIIFGEADGSRSARGERFLAACKNAGIEATFSTEIAKDLWAKFALLSAWTGVSSVLRQPAGKVAGDHSTRKLFADALTESVAIAKAKGVDLGDDYLAKQRNFVDTVPPETKSSMQMDLDVGRRLELDWMSGAVARIGDELGVPTPIHHFMYAALKLYADGSKSGR
jgi:2-dehydropantoate 2-reductase